MGLDECERAVHHRLGEAYMRQRTMWLHTLVLTLGTTVIACGGGQDTSSTESSAPAAGQKVDMATAGNITGSAMLEGTAPANEPIRMNADPICVREVKG